MKATNLTALIAGLIFGFTFTGTPLLVGLLNEKGMTSIDPDSTVLNIALFSLFLVVTFSFVIGTASFKQINQSRSVNSGIFPSNKEISELYVPVWIRLASSVAGSLGGMIFAEVLF